MTAIIGTEKFRALLKRARIEIETNAGRGTPLVGYNPPNYVDSALMEIQIGLLEKTVDLIGVQNQLLQEARRARLLSWAIVGLTIVLAVLTAALLLKGA